MPGGQLHLPHFVTHVARCVCVCVWEHLVDSNTAKDVMRLSFSERSCWSWLHVPQSGHAIKAEAASTGK